MATLLRWPPCYYDHFILTRLKVSYLKNLFNMAAPLTGPDYCGPLVTDNRAQASDLMLYNSAEGSHAGCFK